MAAQIVHASGESIKGPLPPHTNAVVLSVKNQAELLVIATKLQLAGIPHILIREVDPPYDGHATAIGIVPLSDRREVKKIVSGLPLLGKKDKLCSVEKEISQVQSQD